MHSTDPTAQQPPKAKGRLTDDQKSLHARLRHWTANPTNKTHLERLIDCMVDYELKARLKAIA